MRRFRLAAVFALCSLFAPTAEARVLTDDYSDTFTPSSPTSSFTISFPFVSADHLVVVLITEATGAETTLTRGTNYTIRLPVGSTQGTLTMVSPSSVTSTHTLTVTRDVPLTQTTSFSTQGTYSASLHEAALDKLTMIAQELSAAAGANGDAAVSTHVGLADAHTQYALLAGRASGQHLRGGTAAGENLQLSSTNHLTKGKLLFGSGGTELVIDDVNNRVGIGTASPTAGYVLDVIGAMLLTGDLSLAGGAGTLTFTDTASSVLLPDNDATALDIGASGATGMMRFDTTNGVEEVSVLTGFNVENSASFETMQVSSSTAAGMTVLSLGKNTPGNADQRLDFFPDDSGTYQAALIRAATANGDMTLLSNGTGMMSFEQAGAGSMRFYVNGATRGTITSGGDVQWVGAVSGLSEVIAGGAAYTVVAPTDCGGTVTTSTNNAIITLPAAASANSGCRITVVNTAADGAALISVQPNAVDGVIGSCVGVTGAGAATVVQFSGTNNKAINNTLATQNKGDYVTVVSDGSSDWYTVGCVGEWASTP
jgi:hypothetical protein